VRCIGSLAAGLAVLFCFGFLLSSSLQGGEPRQSQASPGEPPRSIKPNDPLFGLQYQFEKMHVLEAWTITQGSPDCLVGVVDEGFDLHHPDYRQNILNPFQAAGMGHPATWIHQSHGTAVIGLIVSGANNGLGVAGLAPNCRVVPAAMGTHALKQSNDQEPWNELLGKTSAAAIRYLVDQGCKVINCSYYTSSTPRSAFEYAIEHDVLMVMPSGNANREQLPFPAGTLDVLCVGGIDKNDERWLSKRMETGGSPVMQGSNYGKGLNVVAPMRELVLCMPYDDAVNKRLKNGEWTKVNFGKAMPGFLWEEGGGTSCAAPMGTALAALIRSIRPDLDHKTVIRIVEQGADDLGEKGWDKYTGYGRVNFYKSLKLAKTWPQQE
jgi:subtilisin family serine protease